MKSRYLFPCPHCHADVSLTTTQAGQSVQCGSCEALFEAPKLQQIKACPLAEPNLTKAPSHVDSHSGRATIVAGLILLIVGGAAGGALYFYANAMVFELDLEDNMTFVTDRVAAMNDAEVYREWYFVEKDGDLGEWAEAPIMRYRAQGLILKNIAYGLFVVALLGLITALIGLFYTKNSK